MLMCLCASLAFVCLLLAVQAHAIALRAATRAACERVKARRRLATLRQIRQAHADALNLLDFEDEVNDALKEVDWEEG